MRSKQFQQAAAAIAVGLSLLMLYSVYQGWHTRTLEMAGLAFQKSSFGSYYGSKSKSDSSSEALGPRLTPTGPPGTEGPHDMIWGKVGFGDPAGAAAAAKDLPPQNQSPLGNPYYIWPKAREDTSVQVTIVVVVTVGTKMEAFETARNSMQCYAALHGYTVSVEYDDKFKECTVHKDKFFRRHCHTHKLMKNELKEDSWALFIDGDVGVVNPTKLIEDYMEPDYEIYLFDRFYNWEYAALSYLVKNNERGRAWVAEFTSFEFKLPKSFHGTDNGALHPFLMQYLVPENRDPKTRSRAAALCLSLWDRSGGYEDLFGMQACTRMVIGERVHFPEHKLMIYQKGDGWAHDLWIFHSHWATDDFMMHSLKEENFKPFPTDVKDQQKCRDSLLGYNANEDCKLVFPILKKLNIDKCKAGTEGWLMEGRLQIDNETRRKVYEKMAYRILKQQMELVGKTGGKIQNI